jgi:hypothetical protein
MRFGGQMHDGIGAMISKNTLKGVDVADIHLLKKMARMSASVGQRFEVTGVGEFIDIDNCVFSLCNAVPYYSRTDKPSAACDEYFYVMICASLFVGRIHLPLVGFFQNMKFTKFR